MRVLALDTASPAPSLAVLTLADGQERIEVETLGTAAAEALPAHLEQLLARAGLSLHDLDRVAVLSGPGSFTGLRAGTAFARGLARALDVPLVAAGTFRAACAALGPADADLTLNAGRGEVHRARLRAGVLHEETRPVPAPEAATGDVPVRSLDLLRPDLATSLARLAAAEEPAAPLSLLYGRPSAAEERWGA